MRDNEPVYHFSSPSSDEKQTTTTEKPAVNNNQETDSERRIRLEFTSAFCALLVLLSLLTICISLLFVATLAKYLDACTKCFTHTKALRQEGACGVSFRTLLKRELARDAEEGGGGGEGDGDTVGDDEASGDGDGRSTTTTVVDIEMQDMSTTAATTTTISTTTTSSTTTSPSHN